jgi:hypothetical protein
MDLASDLEQEKLAGCGDKLTASLCVSTWSRPMNRISPFSKNASQLRFYLISKFYRCHGAF